MNIFKKTLLFVFTVFLFSYCTKKEDQEITEPEEVIETNLIYFPNTTSNSWETTTPADLNWNATAINELNTFLKNSNTKGFIILHKGRIALEEYFNEHTADKIWYWASAGKTLTTTTVGIAQDAGILSINAKVSDYLGMGWTTASLEKENLITCKNLLSMNSGLNDTLGDDVSPENLKYTADANSRWAYHNVYVKLQDIVTNVSSSNWEDYFSENLKNRIGMDGNWSNLGDLSVYWSTTRSMARFGLLISAKGKWNDTQIISEPFLNKATTVSQNINLSYGYLWWLNGKSSYHLPQSQFTFTGSLVPNAPDDMYAALGKNDQKLYIVPSKDLVIVRMGQAASNENFALSNYDNELWEKINNVIE